MQGEESLAGLHCSVTVVETVCPCEGVNNWGAVTWGALADPDEVPFVTVDAAGDVAVAEVLPEADAEPDDAAVEVGAVFDTVETDAVPEDDGAIAVVPVDVPGVVLLVVPGGVLLGVDW